MHTACISHACTLLGVNTDYTHFHFDRLYLVSPSATVRDLGVFIDQDLTMKTHLQWTASRCFATLRQLRSIRRYIGLPTPVFQSLVSTLVLSCLDYCNSLLINLPLIHIQRLQSVQNTAARLIFNLRRCDHITPIGFACQSELHSRWRCWRTVHPTALHHHRLLGVVIHMCRRHAAPTQAQVRLHWTAWRSNLPSVNSWRSCFSCCWCWRRSRTGSRRTAAATKVFDWMTFSFPSNFIPPEQLSLL